MDNSPIVLAHEEPFSIGAVEVRPSTREMWLAGKAAILEPRVMQVLVALWRAQGQVVSKDDLIACCWDQRVVGDDAINRVISRLRHNADEDANGAFKIETISRVGYRLKADGVQMGKASILPLDRRRVLIGSAAVGAVALGGWAVTRRESPPKQVTALISDATDAILESTPDQFSNAVGKLRRAVELDPDNAEAWGLLSMACFFQSVGLPSSASDQARREALAAADRALSLDPHNGDAETAKFLFVPEYGNWLGYQRSSEQVLARHPDNFFANMLTGKFLGNVGRFRDSMAFLDRGLAIHPNAVGPNVARAVALDDVGRTAEAQALIDRVYRIWPTHYGVWFTRLYTFAYSGRVAEGLAMMDDPSKWPVGIPPANQEMTKAQITALGDRSEKTVKRAVDLSMAMAGKGTGFAENAMIFTGTIGLADRFFELAERYFFDPTFLADGPRFSQEQRIYTPHRRRFTYFLFRRTLGQMWHDPRFNDLTRRIGLDDYWRAARAEPDFKSL